MKVLNYTLIGIGLVVLISLGCSSENETGSTVGQINVFCTDTDLNWDVFVYKPINIDSTDVYLDGNNEYINLEVIRSKYEGLDDSLSVNNLSDQGASVIFDSIQPGTYDLIIYTSLNNELDTAVSIVDTLLGENKPPDSQPGYKPIYVAGVTIKKGQISVINITSNLASEFLKRDSEFENPMKTVYIKWKEKYLQIEQEKVASSNKAFGQTAVGQSQQELC